MTSASYLCLVAVASYVPVFAVGWLTGYWVGMSHGLKRVNPSVCPTCGTERSNDEWRTN